MPGFDKSLSDDLGASRELSVLDMHAIEVVEGLIERIYNARADIAEQGAVVNGCENPACLTERTASAEIRGWIKERPDLFGEVKSGIGAPGKGSRLGKFKVVK